MCRLYPLLAGSLLLISMWSPPAHAQDTSSGPSCMLLCTPELALEPTVTLEPIVRSADVRNLQTGSVTSADPTTTFEIVAALGVPTTIPRVELTGEVIWTPFAETGTNPFTGRSADELEVDAIDDNAVELEFELNLMLLTAEATGGWVEAHFDVVDQLSPAEQPDDTRLYTHKLNFELDASVAPFHRFETAGYLRHVELEGSLDYLATGLPQEGDVLGDERFLEDASPWGFSVVLILPLAPLPL